MERQPRTGNSGSHDRRRRHRSDSNHLRRRHCRCADGRDEYHQRQRCPKCRCLGHSAIAKAIGNSGLAELVGNALISGLSGMGETGILIGIFILTSSFTLLITNNAAAAIVFPIALSVTQTLNLNPQSVMLTLALAASTCF
ncbi:MAG TPA: hypothetical protein ENN20_05870, partial [Candidatus Marinimicrobia bacterium]|nr:hypothetical protein [Candidatus Neomarinimicrobiota bacterium]